MTVNRDQKSLLAKLMASENITVQHQNAQTACFDVKNRVLTLPIFADNTSDDVYDLMVSHEVGHALWTPEQGWHDAVCEQGPIYKGFLNIIEDARIERKIKQKYPGIVTSYRKGYKELLDKNFFGLKGQDVSSLTFIDRINIFFKTGTLTGLQFEGDELGWVAKIAKTETFEDVKKLADELFASEKKKVEEKLQEMEENGEFEPQDDFEDFDMDADGSNYDDSEEGEEETDGNGSASGEGEMEEDTTEDEGNGGASSFSPDGSAEGRDKSMTGSGEVDEQAKQEAFEDLMGGDTERELHQNQGSLNKANAKDIKYHYLPETIKNWKDFLVTYKEVIAEFDRFGTEQKIFHGDSSNYKTGYLTAVEKAKIFRKNNMPVINMMVKEFEMRKKADEHKRTSVAKSGELDMNKIFGYKFNDDLFLRNAVVREGKNHGFVMYIDWSGSMASQMSGTIDQLLNLVMFCRKIKIPFEVFAFTDGWTKRTPAGERVKANIENLKVGDLIPDSFALVQLFSAQMSLADYNRQFDNMFYIRQSLASGRYYANPIPGKMQLGSTPLNDALTISTDLLKAFKAKYKVQVVNFVILTDGDSHNCGQVDETFDGEIGITSARTNGYNTDDYIYDRMTKRQYKIDRYQGCTSQMIEAVKDRVGCNTIGIYLIDNKPRDIRNTFAQYNIWNVDVKEFRAKKFFEVKTAGYDSYFIMPGGDLALDNEGFEVADGATKARIKTAFMKHAKGKTDNRVFIGKLMATVS